MTGDLILHGRIQPTAQLSSENRMSIESVLGNINAYMNSETVSTILRLKACPCLVDFTNPPQLRVLFLAGDCPCVETNSLQRIREIPRQ